MGEYIAITTRDIHMSDDSGRQIDVDALLCKPRLQRWLDANIPELGSAPLAAKLISGGTSNVILGLNRGRDISMVMRRPPADPPPGSKRTVEREATLLSALNATDVPHPHVYGKCFDPGVVGASFYIMELVDGWAPALNHRNCLFNPPFDEPPLLGDLAYAMIDGLIALANVDYQAIGLEDFGKPDGFLERQVGRWGSQLTGYKDAYRNYPGREIPGLTRIADWLQKNIPASHPGLIHGDYGFPNVMFRHAAPARLAAMIDWELSTVGDPLLDVAWYLTAFRDAREPDVMPRSTYFDAGKFPTRQELARHWAKGTGRDITHLDYFLVLAGYKSTCILEYKVAAAMDGLMPKATGEMFDRFVMDSAFEAGRIIDWNR